MAAPNEPLPVIAPQVEKAAIDYEEFIKRVLAKRASPRKWWESSGLVSAATAVLTVVVTSILSYYTQKNLRERENRFSEKSERVKAAGDAATAANSAIASILKISEERLKIAHGDFSKDRSLQAEGIRVADTANRLQQQWRQARENVEMQLYLAFDSGAGVSEAWKVARASLDQETMCIENLVERSKNGLLDLGKGFDACDSDITAASQAVTALRSKLKAGYEQIRRDYS